MASAQYAKKALSEEEKWFHNALYSQGREYRVCEPILDQNMNLLLYSIFRTMIPKYGADPSLYKSFGKISADLVSDCIASRTIRRGGGRIWLDERAVPAAKKEWNDLEFGVQLRIQFLKEAHNTLPHNESKCYFYHMWPQLAKDAGEYEWFEKNRLELAVSMYGRRHITLSSAASTAGLAYEDFMDEIGRRGISIMGES